MFSKRPKLDVFDFFQSILFLLQFLQLIMVKLRFGNQFHRVFLFLIRNRDNGLDPLLSEERSLLEFELIVKQLSIAFDELFLIEIAEHEKLL
jgi:hypothetical protein